MPPQPAEGEEWAQQRSEAPGAPGCRPTWSGCIGTKGVVSAGGSREGSATERDWDVTHEAGGEGSTDSVFPAVEELDFAGWGTVRLLEVPQPDEPPPKRPHDKLGTWFATAICGNDITSSCLYVSALAAGQAGALAPLALAMVAGVLYLFRSVYAEVGSALPLNGGTYTVLLNTTNKRMAAGAAVLTLLSYVATAVISAGEAMHYAHNLWHGLPVFEATIALLALFAFLNILGISESALVALVIFLFHLASLTLLSLACAAALVADPSLLAANWSTVGDFDPSGLAHALFFGFAAAMLGISGFESSANFIEEQKEGVFPKTLRNMWLAVSVFNPLISFLSLAMLPLAVIQHGGSSGGPPEDLLARMGNEALRRIGLTSGEGGTWLGTLVSIDAVLVLSGAVLTSFVGVTGLMRRMALDRCLPQFLLRTNAWRGTNHWIISSFLLVCVAILVSTEGQVSLLAGVYTISFLSVMALFAIGNMLLKVKRRRLPRATRASWGTVLFALAAVLAGLVGNVLADPDGVRVFSTYLFVFGAVVAVMFLRIQLLRLLLGLTHGIADRVLAVGRRIDAAVRRKIEQISGRPVVFFTKGDDPALLNRAALYVRENEQTRRMVVVHVTGPNEEPPPQLAEHLREIDRLYPDLRIDLVLVRGTFGPALIERLSEELKVPRNYMFIGTPSDRFPHRIEELGGVRLIL